MKKLMITVLALTAMAAEARWGSPMPTADTTWKKLGRDQRVIFELPQVQLGNWFMRVGSLCIEGENLRSKRKVTSCTRYQGGDNDRCVEERLHYVYKPITGEATRCVDWRGGDNDECTRYATYTYTYTIPTDYEIPVYRRRSGGRDGDDFDRSSMFKPLFHKGLVIPACL